METARVELGVSCVREHADASVATAVAPHYVALDGALRSRGEEIRRGALEAALGRLGPLSDEHRAQIEAFSRALLDRLLHEPSSRLRACSPDERGQACAAALRELFGLTIPGSQ